MTDSGPAIKEGGRATQTFDSTSRRNKWPWQVCCCDGIDGGCRPAASWCSGFSLATVFVVFVLESYPFLAITSPVPSDTLAVEGWMHQYAMREAAAEYAIIGTFLRLVVRP